MDLLELTEEARVVPREQFVAKYPGLFLVLADSLEEHPIPFRTIVAPATPGRKPDRPAPEVEILPIAKAANNPYSDRISLGRARNCDLVVRDPSVSKLHGHFRGSAGELTFVDLGSQNGTRVNGNVLSRNVPHLIRDGDSMTLGSVKARIVGADALFDLLQ